MIDTRQMTHKIPNGKQCYCFLNILYEVNEMSSKIQLVLQKKSQSLHATQHFGARNEFVEDT